jgi:hypothetical protein
MGFTSLDIHLEIHKIHIKSIAILIRNHNLILNLFLNTKVSKPNSIFV